MGKIFKMKVNGINPPHLDEITQFLQTPEGEESVLEHHKKYMKGDILTQEEIDQLLEVVEDQPSLNEEISSFYESASQLERKYNLKIKIKIDELEE